LDRELEQENGCHPSDPRIRCPLCGWSPRKEDKWFCTCGYEQELPSFAFANDERAWAATRIASGCPLSGHIGITDDSTTSIPHLSGRANAFTAMMVAP